MQSAVTGPTAGAVPGPGRSRGLDALSGAPVGVAAGLPVGVLPALQRGRRARARGGAGPAARPRRRADLVRRLGRPDIPGTRRRAAARRPHRRADAGPEVTGRSEAGPAGGRPAGFGPANQPAGPGGLRGPAPPFADAVLRDACGSGPPCRRGGRRTSLLTVARPRSVLRVAFPGVTAPPERSLGDQPGGPAPGRCSITILPPARPSGLRRGRSSGLGPSPPAAAGRRIPPKVGGPGGGMGGLQLLIGDPEGAGDGPLACPVRRWAAGNPGGLAEVVECCLVARSRSRCR